MTVKSQSDIVNSRDLQALIQLACKLIGEICLRVNFSYGDELMLNFGDRVPYSQASMSGQEKGAWILGTRISPWQVYSAGSIVADSETDSAQPTTQVELVGKRVLDLKIDKETMLLSIDFTDGLCFVLIPELELEAGLPDWELFMPDGMALQVGRLWSLIDAR